MNPITRLTQPITTRVSRAAPFGKFERFTAGFCMSIPFFLIIADTRNLWLLPLPIVFILTLPVAMPWLMHFIKDSKNQGLYITAVGGLLFFGTYLLFSRVLGLTSRPSISDYVEMEHGHIFGMLLAVAAMLFITNGFVYRDEKTFFAEGEWRSFLNITLGLLLSGVILFHLERMRALHMISAGFFFFGCMVSTAARETKQPRVRQQRIVDFLPLAIMAGSLLVYFGQEWGWWCGYPFNLVNLFGAESIALWITGLDFILVSMKKERNLQWQARVVGGADGSAKQSRF